MFPACPVPQRVYKKTPAPLLTRGPCTDRGAADASLGGAADQHLATFGLGALEHGGDFGINLDRFELPGVGHLRVGGVGNFGGRAVRRRQRLGVEHLVAVLVGDLDLVLLVLVADDRGHAALVLVLHAEELTDSGERVERVEAGRTARSALALGQRQRHHAGRLGRNARSSGTGRGGRIGRLGVGECGGHAEAGEGKQCNLLHDQSPTVVSFATTNVAIMQTFHVVNSPKEKFS